MYRLLSTVVCTLGLGLSACVRPNPAFGVAGSDVSSSGGVGESVDSDETSTTRATDGTTSGSASSEPSPASTTTADTSGVDLTTTETSTTSTETSNTGAETGSTGTDEFRRVFVTSDVFGAELGGIEGADAKCQAAADAAGLGGTFRAWISTPASSPLKTFVQSAGPYVRIDGLQIAENWTRLVDGDIDAPLEIDEWGDVQNNGECGNVWTNTMRDGTSFDDDACMDWTSLQDGTRLGRTDATNASWTEGCTVDCLKEHHLYCFEQ